MGDLGHIAGIGNLAIPSHPVPPRLLFTAAPSDIPLYLSPAVSDVCLGKGPLIGSPPGPSLPVGFSASTPPLSPLRVRRSDTPSGNHPVP